MNALKKLQKVRFELTQKTLKKSGNNKFAGYSYFELGDFLPHVHQMFNDVGLCAVFSIDAEKAGLSIFDTDGDTSVEFFTPTVMASNPKGQAIQNLGSTHTYLRRYLWVMALELVESDEVDAGEPKVEKPVEKKIQTVKIDKPKAKVEAEPWRIEVDIDPGSDPEAWLQSVQAAADLALGFAESSDDVMAIYRRNKELFETIKSLDEEFFKNLMNQFREIRLKLEAK
jgi:hypothetical protein